MGTPLYDQMVAERERLWLYDLSPIPPTTPLVTPPPTFFPPHLKEIPMADHEAEDAPAPINPKVPAAAAGAGVAASAVILVKWIAGLFGLDIPDEVVYASIVVFSTLGGYVAGYVKRGPA